jgi:CheY-like chemotaxis protein
MKVLCVDLVILLDSSSPSRNFRDGIADSGRAFRCILKSSKKFASCSCRAGQKSKSKESRKNMPQTEPVVFVVDDEEIIAKTLAIILSGSGFYAKSFTDPSVALAEARKMEPNLLITDVSMPGMSGIDLAIEMKRVYPKCKTLLFSKPRRPIYSKRHEKMDTTSFFYRNRSTPRICYEKFVPQVKQDRAAHGKLRRSHPISRSTLPPSRR